MPIDTRSLMDGLRYEVWKGRVSLVDLYQAKREFINYMDEAKLPFYVTIVDLKPQIRFPDNMSLIDSLVILREVLELDKTLYIVIDPILNNSGPLATLFYKLLVVTCPNRSTALDAAKFALWTTFYEPGDYELIAKSSYISNV